MGCDGVTKEPPSDFVSEENRRYRLKKCYIYIPLHAASLVVVDAAAGCCGPDAFIYFETGN